MAMYTTKQLELIRKLVYMRTGITLSAHKDTMIWNRLERLRALLGYNTIGCLLDAIESGKHAESFISAITTNKTNFFRENFHFDDLLSRVMPKMLKDGANMKIYCAAAATGEEPYSIAMAMEYCKVMNNVPLFYYSLIASDIDSSALDTAKNGVYEWERSSMDFPSWVIAQNYFKRRDHPVRKGDYLIKVKDALKKNIKFGKMNLMNENYPFKLEEFDIIFCRNVLIYFNQADQNSILKKLFRCLKMGGTLYLGHSESPLELSSHVERLGHNIFIKKSEI